ncbi:Protein trapped in endoderm-1 [Halotydeus destructor]|nr:Protein trapped in endoderm-1 [Halotydeus destructor]
MTATMNVTVFNRTLVRTAKQLSFLPNGPSVFEFSFSVVIIFFGTIFNLLAILSLWKHAPKLKAEASTKFVLNLAFSDLMFCSVTLPVYWLQRYFRSVPFWSDFFCNLNQTTFFWTFELSLLSLAVVSLNRLVLIVYHDKYDAVFSKNNIRFLIAFLWIFSFALTVPPLTGYWGQFIILRKSSSLYCGLLGKPHPNGPSPKTFLYCFGFTVPFMAIIVTYGLIWNHIRKHAQHFRSSKQSQRSFRFFKVVMVIFLVFLICYVPNLVMRGIMTYSADYPYLRQVVKILVYSNAMVNPVIYFALNRDYRTALFSLFGKQVESTKSKASVSTDSNQTT